MKKVKIIVILLLLLFGCSKKEKGSNIDAEITNSRYLSAAQLYSSITTFYPNSNLEEANAQYIKLLDCIKNKDTDFKYARQKELLLNSVLDLHNIYEPNISESEQIGFLPVKLKYIRGKIYVYQNSDNSPIPIFSEIIKINNLSIKDYLSANYPSIYNQCRSDADFNYLLNYLETGELGYNLTLTYSTEDSQESVQVTYKKGNRWVSNATKIENNINFLYIGTNYSIGTILDIIYIRANNFNSEPTLESYISQLSDEYHKIILDLRDNVGGNDVFGIHLISPFISNSFTTPKQIYNNLVISDLFSSNKDNFKYGNYAKSEIDSKFYEKDFETPDFTVAVLINNECQSSCEAVAYYEQQQDNAVLIGEATKGALGNIYEVKLDDGSTISFPITLANIDNSFLNSVGIKPDIEVENTIDEIKKNEDIALSVAINYLNGK